MSNNHYRYSVRSKFEILKYDIRLIAVIPYIHLMLFLGVLTDGMGQNKAIAFSKSGDYLEVSHHPDLARTVFTIEFWLRVHELGDPDQAGGEQTIVDKRSTSSGYNIRLAGEEFPLPLFAFYQDGGASTVDLIKQHIWHHIAVVQSNLHLKIFVDGVEAANTPNSNYTGVTSAPLRIGEFLGHPGASLGLRGALDEMRIWNEARTEEEIVSNMHSEMTGNEHNLVAYWRFDQKNGNFVLNESKNAHHAKIHGNSTLVESSAPVGFIPPNPQTGLRGYGEKNYIELTWEPDSSINKVHIYRNNSPDFLPAANHLLSTVSSSSNLYQDNSVVANQDYYYFLVNENLSGHRSQPSTTLVSRTRGLFDDYQVGVYYYPWYGPKEEGHTWIGQYTRDLLIQPQPPLLGHYSSRDTSVVEKHLDWMTAYGIDFLVSSWWGRDSWEDITLKDVLLDELAETKVQFSVYYESAMLGFSSGGIEFNQSNENRVVLDFIHLAERYFSHPNYLKINGRPVVFLYLSAIYYGSFQQTFNRVRQEILARGFDIYFIGDEVGFGKPDPTHAQFLDAVSPYITLELDRHAGYPAFNDYFADLSISMKGWENTLQPNNQPIIPNINPGFNNHKVSSSGIATSRQYGPNNDYQSKLRNMIRMARPFVDQDLRMIMITSWNEWHEDTQIEPVIVAPPTNQDQSISGNLYTKGYEFEGYGFKPLEVVRALLSDQSCNLTSTLFTQPVSCFGAMDGKAQVKARGAVEPVTYQWSTVDTTSAVSSLDASEYTITVQDGVGCELKDSFTISQPSEIGFTLDSIHDQIGDQPGSIHVTLSGGSAPYIFNWKEGEKLVSILEDLTMVQAGEYSLLITDQNGCTVFRDSLVIDQVTDISLLRSPIIKIYPNPNYGVFHLTVQGQTKVNSEVYIYNSQGQLGKIMESRKDSYSIQDLAPGLYFCKIRIGNQYYLERFVKGK